ncbi:amino acid permease-domain-containing protein [Truncatella angustata]|uniref:Amino acid permease-domain-containing protein n=1 Tax=Truncatella angustata TaxID=152316 RepID=A0A9P8RKA3_9PEZI|nr:amino acid permease-domain-containing protein [Truncatella angustata]KAH6643310.1 amino acid permease-domain-containing protein [Truncatella angustata]
MADPPSPPVMSALPTGDRPDHLSDMSEDEAALAALGYKQEFRVREFSAWTTFAVSFAVMGLLPSIATTMWYGIGYAGPAANTWAWLLSVVFIFCVAASMAELASSMPTSGGLYYASAVLAGPKYGPFAAWITGWSNWFTQVTAAPSVNYGCAAMILAGASIMNPDYVPNEWQTYLLTVFIMIIHACISSMPTLWIANFNSVGTVINILCLVITIIIIPAAAMGEPKFQPNDVAWGIQNSTGWPDGVAVLMSFLSIIWTMSGYDASFHLSEECSNAAIATPRSIVFTALSGGVFGFFLNLTIAYTIVDIGEVIESDLGQPWAAFLVQVLPQPIAMAVLAMTIICAFSMGQGCMVAASRVCFAYARDDCFGFLSRHLKKVNRHTLTPVNAVWFNTSLGIILLLLIFGGVAIGAIFSIGAIASYVAFTIPIFIKTVFVGNNFRRGPWHLGRFSLPSGIISVSFVLVMMPILCFPTVTGADLTPELMNWTSLVYGVPMLAVIIWFFVDARKWFKGPKINIEHHMLHQDLSAHPGVEGIEPMQISLVKEDGDVERGSSDKKLPL